MTDYHYDLHIHSCLSPCADNDMTPANIAGMATLNGLRIVALTDHNSTKNCPAFFKACKVYGIIPIPGMELTTSEEVHMVCLFRTLEEAMGFGDEVETHLMHVKNRPSIFGDQRIVDEEDTLIAEYDLLLIMATDVTVIQAVELVRKYRGVCFPAHIDRESNGIIAVLGAVPENPSFPTVELSLQGDATEYAERLDCKGKRFLFSSDAHHLWDVADGGDIITIDDEPYSSQRVRDAVIDLIKAEA